MKKDSYEFVIVGGGIVGCSLAYWLTELGQKDIVVLERDIAPGAGSTSKSAGGIRAQFSNRINILLQKEALKFFESFDRTFEGHSEFNQAGYLFTMTQDKWKRAFEKSLHLQREMGLDITVISKEDVRRLSPFVDTDGIIYATFHQRDGYLDPHGVVQGIYSKCKERGVEFRLGVAVTGIKADSGKVQYVETAEGKVRGRVFFNCAGAWSGELAKMAGGTVPVYPVRRMLFFTKPIPVSETFPAVFPMTIDMDTGVYMRRETGGLLLGMEDDSEPPGFDTSLRWEWLEVLIEAAMKRFPAIGDCEIQTGWAGLYDMSADHSAVMGMIPGFKNFYVISGFSGHGVMQGPIAAKLVAEDIVLGKPSIDYRPLRVERFEEKDPVEEINVI